VKYPTITVITLLVENAWSVHLQHGVGTYLSLFCMMIVATNNLSEIFIFATLYNWIYHFSL